MKFTFYGCALTYMGLLLLCFALLCFCTFVCKRNERTSGRQANKLPTRVQPNKKIAIFFRTFSLSTLVWWTRTELRKGPTILDRSIFSVQRSSSQNFCIRLCLAHSYCLDENISPEKFGRFKENGTAFSSVLLVAPRCAARTIFYFVLFTCLFIAIWIKLYVTSKTEQLCQPILLLNEFVDCVNTSSQRGPHFFSSNIFQSVPFGRDSFLTAIRKMKIFIQKRMDGYRIVYRLVDKRFFCVRVRVLVKWKRVGGRKTSNVYLDIQRCNALTLFSNNMKRNIFEL